MTDPSPPEKTHQRRTAVFRLASLVRSYLEPIWPEWHTSRSKTIPAIASSQTCGRSSLFLRNVLRLEGHVAEWTNGIPRLSDDEADIRPFGFLANGRWESHAWVVSGELIVDITADQFGAAPVIVASIDDIRYRAGNVDTASPEAINARHALVAEIWSGWLRYKAEQL